ncbi:MAG TPA: Fic family protein [Candidatus Solibacter sp.]|jgi:Fic family protein|nr:Fic family protein [Candidatus Solibacter sp.]
MDAEMLTLLSKADRALGRLDGATQTLPNPELFVSMYARKEALLSSQIEGTQATLIEVLRFEIAEQPSTPDVIEVTNYVNAMNAGLARLATLPVSTRLIREIHSSLMTGVRGGERNPGEFRTTQNWVGPPGSTLREATYVPPAPGDILSALADLEDFIHADEPFPALIKVGLVHAQFETIHPFLDGNGRMGRLLVTFLLCEQEVLQRPLLYLSSYLKEHQAEYYRRLQEIRDDGAWEEWMKFFLTGVFEVSQEASRSAQAIIKLREEDRGKVTKNLGRGAGAGLQLLESLFQLPVVSVQRAAAAADLSFANANRLVSTFLELGILREITGRRRNRVFAYDAYLGLL